MQDFELVAGRLTGLRTDDGFLAADRAVVAAGAALQQRQKLGDAIPLDTERGYHVVISNPEASPRHADPGYSRQVRRDADETGLRLAGTVEFAGLEASPDWRRARNLLTLGKRLFPGLRDSYPEKPSLAVDGSAGRACRTPCR